MKNSKDKTEIRYQMVRYAEKHGVKPAARHFNTTPKTVRRWLKRWQPGSKRGLEDLSRAPKNPATKITKANREKVIKLKKRYKHFGAERLKELFNLKMSVKAMRKIWRAEKLLKRRRKKHKTKNDLRAVKRQWRLFQQSDVDTKHLKDIPEYWIQMKPLRLPEFQYTFREVVSGLMFIGFAQELSLAASTIFIRTILSHLSNCKIDINDETIQTDNGSEFIGSWQKRDKTAFTKVVENNFEMHHQRIPPGAHTYQSDVETVHNLIEVEFYEVERFAGREDFLARATMYQLWFNTARTNGYKGGKTPWNILHERNPEILPEICLMPPVFLDSIDGLSYHPFNYQRGSYLITLP